jgi:hydroxymethylpyrimidine pyrophosphatase-like HAD family hydrolase
MATTVIVIPYNAHIFLIIRPPMSCQELVRKLRSRYITVVISGGRALPSILHVVVAIDLS